MLFKMKTQFLLFLFLTLFISTTAQRWEKRLPKGAGFYFENSNHHFFNVLSKYTSNTSPVTLTISQITKYGDSVRTLTVISTQYKAITTNGIEVLKDSSFLIFGYSNDNAYVSRISYNGSFLWTDVVSLGSYDRFNDISMLNDSEFIAGGSFVNLLTEGLYCKYSINGTRLWNKTTSQQIYQIEDWTDSTKIILSGYAQIIFSEMDANGILTPIHSYPGWPSKGGFINNNGTLITYGEHYFALRSASAAVKKAIGNSLQFDLNWDTQPSTESFFAHLENSYNKDGYILVGNKYQLDCGACPGYGPFINGYFVKMDTNGVIAYQKKYNDTLYWCREEASGCYLIHAGNKLIHDCCGTDSILPLVSDSVSICPGDSALIFGQYIKGPANDYFNSLTGSNGCDSILYATRLKFKPLTAANFTHGFIPNTVCIDSAPINIPPVTISGGTFSGTGVIGNQFYPNLAGAGNYFVTYNYIDTNGCASYPSIFIQVNLCTSIIDLAPDDGIELYPNPSNGVFNLKLKQEQKKTVQVKILDISMKLLLETEVSPTQSQVSIDISKFSAGIYYLQISLEGKTLLKQVQKN